MNTKVISLCSAKGGVGKSSCTVELASAIKNITNKNVLVLDLDENCSLSKNVGADLSRGTMTTYDVMHDWKEGECEAFLGIQKIVDDSGNYLFDLIPGSKSLSRTSSEFQARDDVFILDDIIKGYLSDEDIIATNNAYGYDYIFIDNAPSRSLLLTMTYIASDFVIIPTVADESSTDLVYETEDDIDKLVNGRAHESHAKVIGYILNNFENAIVFDIAKQKIEEHIEESDEDIKPFLATVRKTVKMTEMKTYKTTMCASHKSAPVSRCFYDIAQMIVERIG